MARTRDELRRLDDEDPLAAIRDRFLLPDGVRYFDGNSLGPLTRSAAARLREVEAQWRGDLVSAWNVHRWIELPQAVGAKIAPLVGAAADCVVVCDSVSVNLFKLTAAAWRQVTERQPGRKGLGVLAEHFPSDLYVTGGLAELLGDRDLVVPLATADLVADPAATLARAGRDLAVVSLGHVDFRTGELLDMARITAAVHAAGALALWDLSHSAGALPVHLADCGVDAAVGCGYKFLCGGPGAPAFLYVAPELQQHLRTPLAGWLGHADPFAFRADYQPAPGVERFVAGTPPILSLAALDAALDVWQAVDLAAVRNKSLQLGDLLIELAEEQLAGFGVTNASPTDPSRRGSQVSLRHPDAYAAMQALIARGVVGDFRAPDLLRFGLCPLFQRFADVWEAVHELREVLETEEHRQERFRRRAKVT